MLLNIEYNINIYNNLVMLILSQEILERDLCFEEIYRRLQAMQAIT